MKLCTNTANFVFVQRETDFLKRLQKQRYSEVSKYEDDYYGEKVLSLSDYRQWVRQQQKRKNDMAKFKQNETATSWTICACLIARYQNYVLSVIVCVSILYVYGMGLSSPVLEAFWMMLNSCKTNPVVGTHTRTHIIAWLDLLYIIYFFYVSCSLVICVWVYRFIYKSYIAHPGCVDTA